ncbi:MAG: hypothetical protein K6T83_03775 [Alicyclobacillus sp.]|nr:hypothetical protein [Alicyclobacillus sp.]
MSDYGFEMDDVRRELVDVEGRLIDIHVRRDWFFNDELDEMDYSVVYEVREDRKVIAEIPAKAGIEVAEEIIRRMYEIDESASAELAVTASITAQEIRMGA